MLMMILIQGFPRAQDDQKAAAVVLESRAKIALRIR